MSIRLYKSYTPGTRNRALSALLQFVTEVVVINVDID